MASRKKVARSVGVTVMSWSWDLQYCDFPGVGVKGFFSKTVPVSQG